MLSRFVKKSLNGARRMANLEAHRKSLGQGCDFRIAVDDPHWREAKAAIELGLELGMNLLDTAESYSAGQSEKIIGEVIEARPDLKAFVASKVSPQNLPYPKMIAAAEASLTRLKMESIFLYQVHWPNPQVSCEEVARGLDQLKRDGKIQNIGVCNFSLSELKDLQRALSPLEISFVQAEYNLFDRSVEVELLPYCQSNNMTLLAYSPLHQGHYASDQERIELLQQLAQANSLSPAQLVLSWLISKPNVVPLPKAINLKHVRDNAGALNNNCALATLQKIDEVFSFSPQNIPPKSIKVVQDGLQGRKAYISAAEAKENRFNLTPSPTEIAEQFRAGEFLKPIRVRPATGKHATQPYELIEGRLRYWGWVLAFGEEKPIPTLVQS